MVGALFAAIGLAAVFLASTYRLGTLRSVGPGFFPTVVGYGLVVVGVAIAAVPPRAEVPVKGQMKAAPRFTLWPTLAVPGAVMAFGLLIERAHLLAAVGGLVCVVWLALPGLRAPAALAVFVLLAAAASALFVYGLDLPASYLLPG